MERSRGQHPENKRDSSQGRIGRYHLLAAIAEGGLTTVFVARRCDDSGFHPPVVLKRLRPSLARQPGFVQLLVDEARLTRDLHHANVVRCLDMEVEDGCYVIQDYVEGESLQGLLTRARRDRHPRFLVPLIVDVLHGLHAVHTVLDHGGRPMSLVHQAPRARHVLIGLDGIARLTDFTQATARGLTHVRERAARLKVDHMAPEQALHPERVDHRADLFLVGVMLWEALTGERLFAAESEASTLRHVMQRSIARPSQVGLRSPPCFDAICLRALERDPDRRYRSSLEMARDLRDAALNQGSYATPQEIGAWVEALVGPMLLERRTLTGAVSSPGAPHNQGLPGWRDPGHETVRAADPYSSGRIYGGSFSRLDPSGPFELDKTPALGVRAQARSKPRSVYHHAPTALHDARRAGSREPGSRPLAGDALAQLAGDALAQLAGDALARPAAGAPTGLRAARETGAPRPGAYSHTLPDRKSRPDALGRPSPTRSHRLARATSRVAVDAPSTADHRTDSTPTRLGVPADPVGSPQPAASARRAPQRVQLPPIPRALSALAGRRRTADVLRVTTADSLAPADSGARSLPPTAEAGGPAPQVGRAMWLVTGVLAAIILLASGLSVRHLRAGAGPARAAAAQARGPLVAGKARAGKSPEAAPVFGHEPDIDAGRLHGIEASDAGFCDGTQAHGGLSQGAPAARSVPGGARVAAPR